MPNAGWKSLVRRRGVVAAAIFLVLVAGVAFGTWRMADPSVGDSFARRAPETTPTAPVDGPGTVSPSAPADPAPTVATEPGELAEVAQTAVTQVLSVLDGSGPGEVVETSTLAAVADGDMLAELEAEVLEMDANEWSKHGAPAVVWAEVVSSEPPSAPTTMTVRACVDSSDVALVRPDGQELPPSTTPRAVNIFTLAADGSGWRVVSRTFPDDPAC